MRNFWAVYTRELKSYFVSPIFYILATVFMISVGNTFKDTFFHFATSTMTLLRRAANYGGFLTGGDIICGFRAPGDRRSDCVGSALHWHSRNHAGGHC